MPTTLDLTAAWVPIYLEPGDAVSIPVTVPAGYETGTWAAAVYRDARRGTPLVSFTVGVVGQIITISLTSAQVAGLLSSGSSRFGGHWELTRTASSAQRTWLKGDFVVDANRTMPANGTQAVALSINAGAVTVTGTAGSSMTGAAILAALAPVDGSGSGLDADTLDGVQGALYATQAYTDGGIATEAVARAAADAALQPRATVGSAITTDTTLTAGQVNQVSTAAGDRIEALPTSPAAGDRLIVHKTTTDGNQVKITGNIAGLASSALTILGADEAVELAADGSNSWWPVASNRQTLHDGSGDFARHLVAFRAALANRAYSPCNVVALGASTVEGQGASVYGRHLVDLLAARLRAGFPIAGVAGGPGWIPCWTAVTGQTGYPAALSGGATQESGERALSLRSARLQASGHTVTFTVTCTSFKIYYSQGITSAGTFAVSVDGGTATNVNTSGTYDRFHAYTSGALTQGSHTITLTWVSGQNVIHGLFGFNQDESVGLRMWNGGKSGTKLDDVVQFLGSTVTDSLAVIQPHLVLLFWGLNDWHLGVSSATYKTDMVSHIAAIRSVCTNNPSIVVVNSPAVWDTTTPPWSEFQAAHAAVVAADPTVGLWNLAVRSPLADNSLGLYEATGTPTHPTDKGHALFAEAGARYLVPAVGGAPASRVTVARARITSGDITLPNTAGGWQLLSTASIPELTLPAAVGDEVEVNVHGMRTATSTAYVDVVNVTGGTPTIQRYMATNTSTPAIEGDPGWYPQSTYEKVSGPRGFTVTAGDLDNGNLRFRIAVKAGGTGTLYASTNFPFYWQAKRYPQS